jgi:uncharacterized paraquat-inducible protein A
MNNDDNNTLAGLLLLLGLVWIDKTLSTPAEESQEASAQKKLQQAKTDGHDVCEDCSTIDPERCNRGGCNRCIEPGCDPAGSQGMCGEHYNDWWQWAFND